MMLAISSVAISGRNIDERGLRPEAVVLRLAASNLSPSTPRERRSFEKLARRLLTKSVSVAKLFDTTVVSSEGTRFCIQFSLGQIGEFTILDLLPAFEILNVVTWRIAVVEILRRVCSRVIIVGEGGAVDTNTTILTSHMVPDRICNGWHQHSKGSARFRTHPLLPPLPRHDKTLPC